MKIVRCPSCATEMPWRRLWLGPVPGAGSRTRKCGHCGHHVSLRDARIMAEAFGYWRSHLRTRLRGAAPQLLQVSPREASRIFGCDASERLRHSDGVEALCVEIERICLGLLLDGSHGHAAELDVVLLENIQLPKFLGVFGFSPAAQPPRHWTILVARVGGDTFVLHTPDTPSEKMKTWFPNSEAWVAAAGAWDHTTQNVAAAGFLVGA